MKTIDIHAHLVPRSLWQAAEAGREWYGFRHEPGEGLGTFLGTNGKRTGFTSPTERSAPRCGQYAPCTSARPLASR